MQAAIGCAQLDKLDTIVARRRENFDVLRSGLEGTPGLILPDAQANSRPSWFGFLITVKADAPFTRNDLTTYLEEHKIQTRNLFAGNLTKHPAFATCVEDQDYRIAVSLETTDIVMNQTFWIGVYPGMTREKLDYMVQTIREFCQK